MPPVPLRLTAVPVVEVTEASLTVTPATAPPERPVAVVVAMLRPRTVLPLADRDRPVQLWPRGERAG